MGCGPKLISFAEDFRELLTSGILFKNWWTHGGCWPLAQALHEYLGDDRTEIWGLGSPLVGTCYHVVLKVEDCFLDGDGASTREQLMKRWKTKFPGQYLILRKLTDREKVSLCSDVPGGPASEEIVDTLTLKFGPCELLWRRIFS